MRNFILIILSIITSSSFAGEKPVHLTKDQINLLQIAYEKGQAIGLPSVIQGILMQESKGGKYHDGMKRFRLNNRPVGVMQLKPVAVRDVLKHNQFLKWRWFGQKTGKVKWNRIRKLLLHNDVASLEFGTAYFYMMLKQSKGNISRALASYNLGYGNGRKLSKPHRHRYVRRVNRWINKVSYVNDHRKVRKLIMEIF